LEQEARLERAENLEKSVKVWTGQLVDLTARNNLLYFKDLKVGTLDLGAARRDKLFDVLVGKSLPLKRLFPDDDQHADAIRRARAVRNRAQEHFEERGLETLFLAVGMATWTNQRGAATPRAPVLLCPARLAPRGAAQEEFELSVTGDLEVNPTLLQMLQTDFDVRCDPEELLSSSGIEGAIDTPEELDVTYEWLAARCSGVQGFDVENRFVLGTFSYAKLPMVKDLEGSLEAMMQHELVAALAGDDEARAAVRGRHARTDPTAPNHTPPADEFLVLDADASQNYAINAVLGGEDLIIKGPPGTGKSQTIANLISTLVARGKRVLFVAEKRAAIDAVVKRLNGQGLGDLVLDLHGGVGSRRQVAQALATALTTNASIPRPDVSQTHRTLEGRRDELNHRAKALHAPREPWNISFFEAQALALRLPDQDTTTHRFRGPTLETLSAETREEARENLRRYVELGGLGLADSGSPWRTASVVSSEGAQAAQGLVERLRWETLPRVTERLEAAARSVGLTPSTTFAGWRQRLELWDAVADCLAVFDEAVFEQELEALCADLEPAAAGAAKRAAATMTSSGYRNARKTLRECVRDGKRLRPPELYASATEARTCSEAWSSLRENGASPRPPAELAELHASFDQLETELRQLSELLRVDSMGAGPDEATEHLDALLADVATLGKLPEIHRLNTALTAVSLQGLLHDLRARQLPPNGSVHAFDYAWVHSVIDHIRLTDPVIGAFDGEQHNRVVAEFQEADRRHIETTAQRVRRLCAEQATHLQDEHPDEGALIRSEAAKKRKHLPVRTLFSAAPDAMLALKPCWAMSPLVVSQILPAERQYFDVVVFDEASQVRPADAIPAILRGKRLVVAGDERQLPPTSFFTGADPDVDEPEMEGRIVIDAGYESILDALLPFLNFRMLEWHYRSHDERLIAFSNTHLYDRGLTTFPGTIGPECMRHVLVPFASGEAGSETSTSAEVARVVELILDHAERRPDESLGVIAMGIKHSDRIEEMLRRALHDRPDLEEFFDENQPERFFIKNLERVQGDERDAIILSVGYGKTPDGRMLYRFGPLNQEGGERRLNVAVTRAKDRMTLVSSFSHVDMDPERTTRRGVELLRLYLQYAESRGENLGERALEQPQLNPFEVDVRDTLERAGIPLCAQYGCSGFRIDYAAKHPTKPGEMVLAIECDGASYHSSATARDRDRLRQEHLERLGWRFHRIWSQDWFDNKEREVEKALAAYKAALIEEKQPVLERSTAVAGSNPAETLPTTPSRGPRPPVRRGLSIGEYRHSELRQVVRWIQSDTLLRTNDQLVAEVMDALGFQKRGSRIVAAIEAAIADERSRQYDSS
jgi:very-short-patch-repair endonuclease